MKDTRRKVVTIEVETLLSSRLTEVAVRAALDGGYALKVTGVRVSDPPKKPYHFDRDRLVWVKR